MRRPLIRPAAAFVGLGLLVSLWGGCAGKKKARSTTELTATATFERGMALLSKRELRQAIATLKRIQFTPDMREETEPLTRLALADATFYQGNSLALIDARNLYLDFVTLNSDHPLAPYAQLQIGVCSLDQVNHPSKDQTETLQAISDLARVELRWPDSTYVEAGRHLLRSARANLAESEFLVGRFYLKKKAYMAAVDRFHRVIEEFPDYPAMEKVLFHLGQAHLRNGNDVEGRIYMDKLVTDYPDGDYVGQARRALGAIGGGLQTDVQALSN